MKQPHTLESSPGQRSWFALLGRLEWLLLLTALALIVLVYPLRLQDAWLSPLLKHWGEADGFWGRWARAQLEPLLSFSFSPLVLKGVVAGIPMLAFVAVRAARLVLAPVVQPAVQPAGAQMSEAGRWTWLSVAAFFLWVVISAWWSPTPLLAQDAAVWAIMYGVFVYLLLRRGLNLNELRQLGVLLLLLGVPVILIVYMQALPVFRGKIFLVMQDFGNIRNKYGSLLGHNSAAAAYLMLTAFPAFAFLLTARTRLRKLAAGVYLGALLFAVLVLQSRAIWVFFPLLGLLAMRAALRALGARHWRWLPTGILVALALVLMTQLVDRPWNPLYIRENPFGRRVKDLSPEGLQSEARLRLNIIGSTMALDRPLLGYGLYAYQYVYPKRQGDYFLAHPQSTLNVSVNRSHMAHNEYLQVLIDHGLIGLALLGWLLGELAWRGWRRRPEDVGARLLHDAFGWSALGFCLHAAVDFPFHVPQLALPGLLCLAAWGAFRAQDGPASVTETPLSVPPSTPESRFRLEHFFRLLLAVGLTLLVPLGALPLARALQADVHYCKGGAYLQTYYSFRWLEPEQKMRTIQEGRRQLLETVKLTPGHYLAWQRLAESYWLSGTVMVQRAVALQRAGKPDPALLQSADEVLRRGLKTLDVAAEGLDYHTIYWLRAQLARQLSTIEPGQGFEQQYQENLNQTLRYCPSFVEAASALAESLAAGPNPDPQRIIRLRQQVLRYDPGFFEVTYLHRANHLYDRQMYQAAARAYELAVQCDPTRATWKTQAALANMMAGNRGRALDLLKQIRAKDPQQLVATGGAILEAALEEKWYQMLVEMTNLTPKDAKGQAEASAIEDELRQRAQYSIRPPHFVKPESVSEDEWQQMVAEARPWTLLHYFNDPRSARLAMEECLARGFKPGTSFWIEGIYIGQAQGDQAWARRCYTEAYQLNPNTPALSELAPALGLAGGSAAKGR